jgi:hypothetical protein
MEYTLSMVFGTEGGLKTTLSISDVKQDITKAQVDTLMDTIITNNVFKVESGALISKVSAQLISRQINKFDVA